MQRDDFLSALNTLLKPELFKDYAPNGLQVEGRSEIRRIVTAVTATQAVIDRAVELKADALLVHHGWFWKGEAAPIVKTKYRRLKTLMDGDINLVAYHLPLDAHTSLGNNALLACVLGATEASPATPESFLWFGNVSEQTAHDFAATIGKQLNRTPLLLGNGDVTLRRIAWCSGAAQDFFEEAIAAGADAYISGEASERTTHLARESGVPFLVCGHHATERLGVQALGQWIENKLGLESIFIDDDNPI